MVYASGGLVEATDYNGFVASVNAVWGVGSSDSGYGQSTTLSTVTAGSSTVTATQWSDLITRIDSMKNHQNAAAPGSGITKPSAGGTITYLSTMSTQIANITTNRLTNNGDGLTAAAMNGGTTFITNTTTWSSTTTLEISLTFLSYNQMRYFFNTGGTVRISPANSAWTTTAKATDWNNLKTAFGPTIISAQSCSTTINTAGYSLNIDAGASGGFYDLSTTNVNLGRMFSTNATGGYNTNYITSYARLNATHASGTATILYVGLVMTDASADTIDDTIPGTSRLDVDCRASNVTYISNVWGTITGASSVNTSA